MYRIEKTLIPYIFSLNKHVYAKKVFNKQYAKFQTYV